MAEQVLMRDCFLCGCFMAVAPDLPLCWACREDVQDRPPERRYDHAMDVYAGHSWQKEAPQEGK